MSKSKQKGTAYESLILQEFKHAYPYAERLALQGAADRGDLYLPGETRFVVECKNEKRFNLAQWYREAKREAANAGVDVGVVVHKRAGCGQGADQWVTMRFSDMLALLSTDTHGFLTMVTVGKTLGSRQLEVAWSKVTNDDRGLEDIVGLVHRVRGGADEYWVTTTVRDFLRLMKGAVT